MQRLVNYESSSCSSAGSVESALGKKKLKPTVAIVEESEVSSSVVQDEPNGLTAESTRDPATTLLQWGCSYKQIEHAIDLWGPATPVEDLFDFIQASECFGGKENTTSKDPICQESTQMESREACALQGHISNTGEKKNSVMEALRYIHTPCYTKEASCSRRQHAGELLQIEENNASALQKLEKIGFPPDLIHRASEECNSIDFDVLFDHLVQTNKDDLHLRNQSQDEVKSLGIDCRKENRSATPLERLRMMGYNPASIQKASDECNSIDFDVLLEYLIEAEDEDLQNQEHSEEDSSEDGGGADTPVKKLQGLGLLDCSIKEAMETSGCQDFEGLLDVLATSEYMNNKGDDNAGGKGRQPLVHIPTLQENITFTSLLKRKHGAEEKCGSSRCQWGEVKWTGNMEKQWHSYVGGKKKSNSLLISESEDSENDMLRSAWEDETLKPGRSKKKVEYSQQKQVVNVRAMQGKMGFGIPSLLIGRSNPIPHHMQGPPYFYYENVASVPNREWDTIQRHFNGLDPEFVDSKFFSATHRRRGYVHNLPIEERKQLLGMPPMTIFEALPDTKKYWPTWDTREKINCIGTRKAPDSLCGLIRRMFQMSEGVDIPYSRQQEIVQVCKKWNLVWVGPGQTAPLEPFEIELLLGFDRDHTRGCSSITERYEALGNSFQVNTVAFHLSPLKFLYPNGITVLSLFSGIGGAEVALDKLGVHLKLVIAVEINEKLRGVLASWWKKSGQTGELRLREDVRDLTDDKLHDLIDEVGKIDLVIGGSPCNNMSGNNRVSRVGLCGIDSSLFFEFTRILNFVRQAMHRSGFV